MRGVLTVPEPQEDPALGPEQSGLERCAVAAAACHAQGQFGGCKAPRQPTFDAVGDPSLEGLRQEAAFQKILAALSQPQ